MDKKINDEVMNKVAGGYTKGNYYRCLYCGKRVEFELIEKEDQFCPKSSNNKHDYKPVDDDY